MKGVLYKLPEISLSLKMRLKSERTDSVMLLLTALSKLLESNDWKLGSIELMSSLPTFSIAWRCDSKQEYRYLIETLYDRIEKGAGTI